jgi:hypothetical protein
MIFEPKTWFYCTPGGWLASGSNTNRSKPMRTTKPFLVIQNGKPIFTVYAYTEQQVRALVAAKVAGETIVIAVALDGASR